MNKTQASRLLTLAWFLKTEVPEDEFKMSSFCGEKRTGHMKHECGTTACALGWATAIWPETFSLRPSALIDESVLQVRGRYTSYYDAPIRGWFGIDKGEALDTFGPSARSAAQVAADLEQLALDHGWTYAN